MKKFLKSLLIAIMLVPLSLSLVACGGDQLDTNADVNTKGNYTEAKIEDLKNFEVKESKEFNSGAKMSLSLKIGEGEGDSTTWLSTDINSVVRWTKKAPEKEGDKTEYTFDQFALRTKTVVKDTTQTTDLYYKDGTKYLNLTYGENEIKYKKDVELKTILADDNLEYIQMFASLESFAETIKSLEAEIDESTSVKVEKATSGKYTKWHITQTTKFGTLETSNEVYYVFKSNKLVGFTASFNTATAKITATVEAFDGEVKLPKDAEEYSTTAPTTELLSKLKELGGLESLEDLFK